MEITRRSAAPSRALRRPSAPAAERSPAPRTARRMRPSGALAALILGVFAALIVPATATAADPEQAAVDGAVAAAAADGVQQSVAVVDRNTGELVAESGGDQQYISESIVKLFTVAYYLAQAGGRPDDSMAQTLRTMIINSDDAIESTLWNTDIVPTVAARYGLENTSNGPKTGPHDWGWELITADDEAKFLYEMSNDPLVAPLLMDAMAKVAPTGSDGFDQQFGMNALTGDHGSKQGWTDIGSSGRVQIHSVGWTDEYFVAILQTSNSSDDETMRADSTATARAVLAAENTDTGTSSDATDEPTPDATGAASVDALADYTEIFGQLRDGIASFLANLIGPPGN